MRRPLETRSALPPKRTTIIRPGSPIPRHPPTQPRDTNGYQPKGGPDRLPPNPPNEGSSRR